MHADSGSPAVNATRDTSPWRALFARIGVELRPGEGMIALALFTYFFLLIGSQYITRSVRDSAWVTFLDADNLPFGFILVAICSYPILVLFARLVDRVPRHHLIAGTSVFFAASLVLFWWLFQFEEWLWVPVVFYVWAAIAFVLTVSQFWSYANHSLDPRQAKRLFGFVGAGGGLGGFVGGQYARAWASVVGSGNLLLISAAIQVGIAGLVYATNRAHPPDESRVAGAAGLAKLEAARGGFRTIRASRHLMLITALMLATVAVANIVNLQFAWAVDAVTSQFDEATGAFGMVYSINSIFGFVFQILLTARIHRFLGIGIAMRVLPVSLAFGTVGLMVTANLFPDPWTLYVVAAALLIGEKGIRYSLDQSTRELLFLPVPSKPRFRAKAYIDVFVQRFAKGVGATIALAGVWLFGGIVQAGWLSLVVIAVWLGVTVAVRSSFVRSFRDGLRARAVEGAVPVDLSDSTSLEMMIQALGSPDPRQVRHALDLLAYHDKGNLVPPLLLYHDSPEVKTKTLRLLARCDRVDAVPMIERLLGDDDPDVRAEAVDALATLHGEDGARLMRGRLHDPDQRVRSAAIASVVRHGDPEAVAEAEAALAALVNDADPEARVQAAAALLEIDEPRFAEELVQLLYDSEPDVARAAIGAVRGRVGRHGPAPLYLPILVSLLRDRRLKHEARDALAGWSEAAIPAFVHFLNDPQEQLWVRRALPKTIARIGGPTAVEALVDRLAVDDQFLRRKVIEALGWLRGARPDLELPVDPIAAEIHQEARRYFLALTDLVSVTGGERFEYDAPRILWKREPPLLLEQLLSDRMHHSVRIVFGMLGLLHSPRDMRAALLGATGDDPGLRAHALEYLDNTLTGAIRRDVFSIIEEESVADKLQSARDGFDLAVQPAADVLRRLVVASETADEDAYWLGTGAIHAICEERVEELYPQVAEAARRQDSSVVQETAAWASRRLGLSPA